MERVIACIYFGNAFNSGDFIIRNHEINFKEKVEFVFGDSDHTEGWMNINVFFNEYLIQTKDRVFWKCRDCEDTDNKDYYFENDERFYENTNEIRGKYGGYLFDPKNKIFFYKIPGNGTQNKVYTYHFDFIINDITELYNGGNDENKSPFQVTHNYYFEVEGFYNVEGNLKGLNINDDNMHYLSNGNKIFKVTDTTGLIYELSPNEINNKYAKINITITAFNYCYTCPDKRVSEQTYFTFIIQTTG